MIKRLKTHENGLKIDSGVWVGLRFAMASVFYVFFYEKLAHVRKKQYLCSRVRQAGRNE